MIYCKGVFMVEDNTKLERKSPNISLYLIALAITVLIFFTGIYLGRVVDNSVQQGIGADVASLTERTNSIELLFLLDNSSDFCPVFKDGLLKIDSDTEKLGYKLAYIEDIKGAGASDPDLKKKYFVLETEAYLLSKKIAESCPDSADFDLALYFYSNKKGACPDCDAQGKAILDAKKELDKPLKVYSFDGDLGSPIADAMKKKYGIISYPSLVINGVLYSNYISKDELLNVLSQKTKISEKTTGEKMKLTGDELTAPFSGMKCVYWESYSIVEGFVSKSKNPFYAIIDEKETKLSLPPVRIFMKPTFENETVKEWCLSPDVDYFVEKVTETASLPDWDEDKTVYYISDAKYSVEERKKYATPRSKWTY